MSKKGQRNGISVSLKSHTKSSSEESQKILFWRMISPRTPGMKSSTGCHWWKFQCRENYTRLSTTWRIQHSECALTESQRELESQRQQLLEANQSKLKLSESVYLCSELKMKDHLHQECSARSCREIEELRIRCCQEENTEKQGRLEDIFTQHDQESRTVNPFLRSWLTEELWHTYVPHQTLISSSSRKPSREVGMLRNTRGNMSIPGNVFDCQHARRDPD